MSEQKKFEDLHRKGAERFEMTWLRANMAAKDAVEHAGFDVTKNRLLCTIVVLAVLEATIPEPATAGEALGGQWCNDCGAGVGQWHADDCPKRGLIMEAA